MPNITFSDRDLDKVKHRQGVYGQLNKPIMNIESVEVAFKKYAKAHGCKIAMLDTEWKRFQKILYQTIRSEK